MKSFYHVAAVAFFCLNIVVLEKAFAGLNFAHKNSTINVDSAKFYVNQPINNWSGTLQQTNDVTGQPIIFNSGFLVKDDATMFLKAQYTPADSRQLLLNSNQLIKIDVGQVSPKITVLRLGNRLSGQPIFLDTDAIRLEHSGSELNLAIQSALNTNVILNGGRITLSSDLFFADDRNFTGSGTVDLLGHSIYMGGASLNLTHTINWKNASDINLTGRTSLSGIWTFSSGNTILNGHGNILDLSTGGTLYIGSGVTAEFTDVTIKGLGIDKGWINFADNTGKIYMSNVTLDFDNRFSVTQGTYYVEGPSTFILKDNVLLFDQLGTLSVDGVTLWKDYTVYKGTSNEGTIEFTSLTKNRALINDGTISEFVDSELIRYNSNTLLYLDRTDSNAKLFLARNNSNAILGLATVVRTDSNAFAYGIKNNSNAILVLDVENNLSRYNSNTLLYLDRTDSNAKLFLARNNSNALL